MENGRFRDVNETTSLTLSSLAVQDGDRLVIKLRYRQQPTTSNTTRFSTLSFGDDSGTDSSEDDSALSANNPRMEFSTAIYFH
jgi:hypothetical protein